MTTPDGTYEAVVLDDSEGFIGQDVCSAMASAGRTTSQTPGPLAQDAASLDSDSSLAADVAGCLALAQVLQRCGGGRGTIGCQVGRGLLQAGAAQQLDVDRAVSIQLDSLACQIRSASSVAPATRDRRPWRWS
jgi:hypothetical protein